MADGSAFNKEQYPALAKIFPSGVLPNLMDKYLKNTNSAGTIGSAGLPNITGYLGYVYVSASTEGNPYGAIVFRDLGFERDFVSSPYGRAVQEFFDASKSNPIYGRSTTVDTDRYTVIPYICSI